MPEPTFRRALLAAVAATFVAALAAAPRLAPVPIAVPPAPCGCILDDDD